MIHLLLFLILDEIQIAFIDLYSLRQVFSFFIHSYFTVVFNLTFFLLDTCFQETSQAIKVLMVRK